MAQNPETTTPDADAQEEGRQDNLPKNTVNVEEAGTLKKKVTVTVPRERIDAKRDEMFGELKNSAQVPGFRVGRAPRRLIEKRFGKDVGQDVRNALIGESLGSAIEDAGLKTLGEPDLDLEKVELPDEGDLTFSFQVEIEPEFALPEVKGIEITKEVFDVNNEKIDEYIQNLREGRARYEKTDEPAREGDGVVTAAKITGEGVSWDNPRVPLRVAPGVIEGLPLVDLNEKLKGKKVGDVATITTKAAETHPNEDWRGKDLTIELTIHEVQRRMVPELNQEFATACGFESVEEFRTFVSDRLKSRVEQEIQRSLRDQICRYLFEKTSFDLPEGVVRQQTYRTLQRHYVDLLQSGVPREKIDENMARLQAAAAERAVQDLKLSFVLSKIAEERGVTVSDDEVNARVAQMARNQNRRPERLRQELAADGSLEQVSLAIRDERTLDVLLKEAKIVEKTAEEIQAAAKTEKEDKKSAKKSAQASEKKKDEEKKEASKSKSKPEAKADAEKKPKKKPAKKESDEKPKAKKTPEKKTKKDK
ncbi:MAG: trigger factor [Phycisphaerae bacterium]|nr:trigger factor [Phycisphaerae bacterium]